LSPAPADYRAFIAGTDIRWRVRKDLDGIVIHYVEAGSETILFIPGWTMPGWIWEKEITHFSQSHCVVDYFPQQNQLDFAAGK
jgi:pimeloyl-ACP methyl ester carboxylesterase